MKKNDIIRSLPSEIVIYGALCFVFLVMASAILPAESIVEEKEGALKPRLTNAGVEFMYQAGHGAKNVSLAGEFNSWNPAKDFLKYDEKRGLWSVVLPLDAGRYEYKFLVDGVWMEGPNLTIEIKKSADGRLAIKEEDSSARSPNTPYSGTINFSGKFMTELGVQRDSPSEDFYAKDSFSHLDLDWNVKQLLKGGLNAFARMEYSAAASGGGAAAGISSPSDGRILLRQSKLTFEPSEGYRASALYAAKNIQFDDPMKIMDRPVSLRYREVEFSDELIPSKAFGLWEQAVLAEADSGIGSLKIFYSDLMPPATYFQGASEDNFGVRYKYSFETALPLSIGFTARRTIGGWWPWANMDNNWFPDPSVVYGYSLDSSTRGLASVWYRGYLNTDFYSIDGKFGFLPGVDLWGESALLTDKELKTVRISGDLASDKRWQIERGVKNIFGIKFSASPDAVFEISYGNSSGDFSPPLYSSGSYPTGSESASLSARIKPSGHFSLGFSASYLKNSDIPCDVPLDLHPYAKNLIYTGLAPYETSVYGGSLVHAVKEETKVLSSVNLDAWIFNGSVKNQTSLLKTLNRYLSSDGVVFVRPPSSGAPSSDDEWILSESLFDASFKISDRVSLGGSVMYFYIEDRKNISADSAGAYFASLKYEFSRSAYLRLGWGLDPEGTDEDILSDFDRREVFLYNKNSGSIMSDVRALSDFNRISLKAVLKF